MSPAVLCWGGLSDVGYLGAARGFNLLISRFTRFSKLKFVITRVILAPMFDIRRGRATSSFTLFVVVVGEPTHCASSPPNGRECEALTKGEKAPMKLSKAITLHYCSKTITRI